MNATLHGGPFDGLDIDVTMPTLVLPEATADTIIEHTYIATDDTRTTYQYQGSRVSAIHIGDLT